MALLYSALTQRTDLSSSSAWQATNEILARLAGDVFVVTDQPEAGFVESEEAHAFTRASLSPRSRVRAFGVVQRSFDGNLTAHALSVCEMLGQCSSPHLTTIRQPASVSRSSPTVAAVSIGDGGSGNDAVLLPPFPHRPPSVQCGIEVTGAERLVCANSIAQFYKNALAWRYQTLTECHQLWALLLLSPALCASHSGRLAELAEDRGGYAYDVVVRLRLDSTPLAKSMWDADSLCAAARNESTPTLHSMSDMAYWGGRSAARVAAMASQHGFEPPLWDKPRFQYLYTRDSSRSR